MYMIGGRTSCPRSQLERTSTETPSFLASGASPPESCKARERVIIWGEGLAMGGIFDGRICLYCAVAYIAPPGTDSGRHQVKRPEVDRRGPPQSCKARCSVRNGGRLNRHLIAAAARGLEAAVVQDLDVAAGVLDQFLPLQRGRSFGDPDPTHTQHVGEEVVRHA